MMAEKETILCGPQWMQIAAREGWRPTKPSIPRLVPIRTDEAVERFLRGEKVWRLLGDGSLTCLQLDTKSGFVSFYTPAKTEGGHNIYRFVHRQWLNLATDILALHANPLFYREQDAE